MLSDAAAQNRDLRGIRRHPLPFVYMEDMLGDGKEAGKPHFAVLLDAWRTA